jgi:hypothetical protein
MKAQSLFKTVTVPASLTVTHNVTGNSFYIEASTGAVDIQFDDGTQLRCKAGQTVELPPGDEFKRITFYNPDTSATLILTYYAGTLSVGTRTPYVYVRPAQTYMKATSYTVLNSAYTSILNTNLRTGKTQPDSLAYVIITNIGASDYLQLFDNAETLGCTINNGNVIQITTSDIIKMRFITTASATVPVLHFYNYDT